MPALQLNWVNESIDCGTDPLMRAPIRQLTNSTLLSWGSYCEQIYSSTDGKRIAFMRRPPGDTTPIDVWVADLETDEIARVGPSAINLMASTPLMDSIYYLRPGTQGRPILVRFDLRTLDLDDVFAFPDNLRPGTPAVSTDEHWFVSNQRLHDTVFALYRIDLRTSRWEFFHEEKDICNTHAQFEPVHGRDILIQQNRGVILDDGSRALRLAGEEGCTLYVIDIDGRNQRFLPIGLPHTPPADGHQCWIGSTGQVLAAVTDTRLNGGTRIVTPGDLKARTIFPGFAFVHVSASADGRYIVADAGGQRFVYLGSLETGRMLRFCNAPCSRSGGHETWEEPYMVPGNRHIIFNSERSGHAELYAATVPDHAMAYLNAPPG
jgi:hypothetical protein